MTREGPFLLVDPGRCVGCRTCELACAAAHTRAGGLMAAWAAGEPLQPRNRVLEVDGRRLSLQCRQCEDAPCVKVCPTGATSRTETYTAVDARLCIGCHLCVMVCPFGAIRIGPNPASGYARRTAFKCDLCVERPGGPACVEACPTRALSLRYPRQVMLESGRDAARQFLAALESGHRLQTGA